MDFMLVGLFGLMNRPNESEMDTLIDAPIQMSCCSLTYKVFVNTHFYRAMLCIRGTSHGPVSLSVLCLFVSVCLSVCLSQVRVLQKRLNVGSQNQNQTIAQGLQFSTAKDLREIRPESPPTRPSNAGGVGKNQRLSTNNRLYLENSKRQTHSFY